MTQLTRLGNRLLYENGYLLYIRTFLFSHSHCAQSTLSCYHSYIAHHHAIAPPPFYSMLKVSFAMKLRLLLYLKALVLFVHGQDHCTFREHDVLQDCAEPRSV